MPLHSHMPQDWTALQKLPKLDLNWHWKLHQRHRLRCRRFQNLEDSRGCIIESSYQDQILFWDRNRGRKSVFEVYAKKFLII